MVLLYDMKYTTDTLQCYDIPFVYPLVIRENIMFWCLLRHVLEFRYKLKCVQQSIILGNHFISEKQGPVKTSFS